MFVLTHDHIQLISAQIGKGWQRGAAGPDAFDCAGLFKFAQERIFGRQIALHPADFAIGNARKNVIKAMFNPDFARSWQRVPDSADPTTWQTGDGILMRRGTTLHIATYFDLGQGQKHLFEAIVRRGVEFSSLAAHETLNWPERYAIRYRGDADV